MSVFHNKTLWGGGGKDFTQCPTITTSTEQRLSVINEGCCQGDQFDWHPTSTRCWGHLQCVKLAMRSLTETLGHGDPWTGHLMKTGHLWYPLVTIVTRVTARMSTEFPSPWSRWGGKGGTHKNWLQNHAVCVFQFGQVAYPRASDQWRRYMYVEDDGVPSMPSHDLCKLTL